MLLSSLLSHFRLQGQQIPAHAAHNITSPTETAVPKLPDSIVQVMLVFCDFLSPNRRFW